MTCKIIDVSSYQGNVDWKSVKRAVEDRPVVKPLYGVSE